MSDTTPASARPQGPFFNYEDKPLRKALGDMGFRYKENDTVVWSPCWVRECSSESFSIETAWRLVSAVRTEGYGFPSQDLALATRRLRDLVDPDLDIEAHRLGPSGIDFSFGPVARLDPECYAYDVDRVLFVSHARRKYDNAKEPWEPVLACVGKGAYDVKDTVLKPCGFWWDQAARTWFLNRVGLDAKEHATFADAAANVERLMRATKTPCARLREAARVADRLEAREHGAVETDAGDDIAEIVERSAEEAAAERFRAAERRGDVFDLSGSQETTEGAPPHAPPPGGARARVKREPDAIAGAGGAQRTPPRARVKRDPDANAGARGAQRTPPRVHTESRSPYAKPRAPRMSPSTPASQADIACPVRKRPRVDRNEPYQSEHPAGATGYLLIVAFDVVLAGCIVPLFACFYVKDPLPTPGLASIIGGTLMRLILEFSLPKDGFLLLPYEKDEFLDYGVPQSDLYPGFFDVTDDLKWDKSTCKQSRFKDYTGVDSLASPVFSFVVFAVVHLWEKSRGKPLIGGKYMTPYTKEIGDAAPAEAAKA